MTHKYGTLINGREQRMSQFGRNPRLSKALHLRRQGMKYAAIANVLSVSEGYASTLVKRAVLNELYQVFDFPPLEKSPPFDALVDWSTNFLQTVKTLGGRRPTEGSDAPVVISLSGSSDL